MSIVPPTTKSLDLKENAKARWKSGRSGQSSMRLHWLVPGLYTSELWRHSPSEEKPRITYKRPPPVRSTFERLRNACFWGTSSIAGRPEKWSESHIAGFARGRAPLRRPSSRVLTTTVTTPPFLIFNCPLTILINRSLQPLVMVNINKMNQWLDKRLIDQVFPSLKSPSC